MNILTGYFSKQTVALLQSKKDELHLDLTASWTVTVGDLDQCVHLWKYTGGFESIDNANRTLRKDPVSLMNVVRQ